MTCKWLCVKDGNVNMWGYLNSLTHRTDCDNSTMTKTQEILQMHCIVLI